MCSCSAKPSQWCGIKRCDVKCRLFYKIELETISEFAVEDLKDSRDAVAIATTDVAYPNV
jgi:hypothetical protein